MSRQGFVQQLPPLRRLEGTLIVGSVCNRGHKVTHVNPEIVFEHY